MNYFFAAALGARFGPGFVRRWQDDERPAVLAGLLVVLALYLTFFIGVGVVALVLVEGPAGSVVAGLFLLPAAGGLAMAAETVTRWWWRGRRSGTAVLRPASSGTPATAVLRSRAALVALWRTVWP